MGERTAAIEPDPGAWATPGRDADRALLVLWSRRRDPCAERVAIELDRRRTPAELAAISADQAEALKGVIHAVLDGIGLTPDRAQLLGATNRDELPEVERKSSLRLQPPHR
jgi:hypothetical protein